MKSILFSMLLLALVPQNQTPVSSSDESPITVVSFKWFKDRQVPTQAETTTGPAAAMIPQNKNFERNRRANAPPGERDPNLDTIDGRSAALDKAVQDSRGPKAVDGYAYRTKIRNSSSRPIEVIFWEYQFKASADTEPLLRRQFLCGVAVKPEKDKELQAFSLTGPQSVVTVDMLSKKGGQPGTEAVLINRIEFADGSIWQRRGWNFGEVRLGYARAVATPWGSEMCRGL
jgi:hypothetical protein